MPENCIFCKIIAGEAPAEIVYQDELVTAFQDIHRQAPTHILLAPNQHVTSVNEVAAEHGAALARLFSAARLLAEQEGIHESGYRLVVNTGGEGGQSVFHLHMHLLGGRQMRALG